MMMVSAPQSRPATLPRLLGEVLAGVISAFIVTPLTQAVDVAISRGASGETTVLSALVEGLVEWVKRPAYKLNQPAFRLCWMVYICTYVPANLVEVLCVLIFKCSHAIPKLLVVTATNMLACIYKDQVLAKIFGKKTKSDRPFPRAGYVCFLLRDLLANAGGFTIPPLLQPSLGAVAAQLAGPALVNLITSPIHFLALDLYNNPDASGSERLRTVGGSYVGATSSRIMKGLAAYGIGGLSNTALRGRVGLPAFEFAATMTRNEL